MTGTDPAIPALARLIEQVSGNVVQVSHLPFLEATVEDRTSELGLATAAAYVTALERGDLPGEWQKLLPRITVKESYLFRTPQHFQALTATIIPALVAAATSNRRLAVWSAGCARGEEPATLAIVLAEHPALAGWDWQIVASDVDEEALAAAAEGRFGDRAVSVVPAGLREKYLVSDGDRYILAPELQRRIHYVPLNLAKPPYQLPHAAYHLVFLRNVLIYFATEGQRQAAAAVAAMLAPEGFLFLGPAETLWQLSDELEAIDLEECFAYRRAARPGSVARSRSPSRRDASSPPVAHPPTESGMANRDRPAVREALRPANHTAPPHDSRPTAELPPPRARLQAAADALAASDLAGASELVDQAIVAAPTDPAAHAIEGLIHDLSGRTSMALASYRAALFLSADLYQVRLLHADGLRRLGEAERARAEYREILATLTRGDGHDLQEFATLGVVDRVSAERRCRQHLASR